MDPSGDNQPLSPGNPDLSDLELSDPELSEAELSEQQVRQILDRTLALLQEQQAQRSGNDQLMGELLLQALDRIGSLMAGMRQSLASIQGLSDHERSLAELSFDGAEALISKAADSGTGSGSAHQLTSFNSRLRRLSAKLSARGAALSTAAILLRDVGHAFKVLDRVVINIGPAAKD